MESQNGVMVASALVSHFRHEASIGLEISWEMILTNIQSRLSGSLFEPAKWPEAFRATLVSHKTRRPLGHIAGPSITCHTALHFQL